MSSNDCYYGPEAPERASHSGWAFRESTPASMRRQPKAQSVVRTTLRPQPGRRQMTRAVSGRNPGKLRYERSARSRQLDEFMPQEDRTGEFQEDLANIEQLLRSLQSENLPSSDPRIDFLKAEGARIRAEMEAQKSRATVTRNLKSSKRSRK